LQGTSENILKKLFYGIPEFPEQKITNKNEPAELIIFPDRLLSPAL
jgi:hypothetical protein